MLSKHKKFLKLVPILAVFGLIALFIGKSDTYIKTTFEGIKVWALVVCPSMLPFFFLTNLLTITNLLQPIINRMSKVSKILYKSQPISLFIRVMSLLCGYPVGAKLICDLVNNNVITKAQGEKYSTFCSTSGPLFVIGAVGVGMLGDKKLGIIIFVSHILSSYLASQLFRKMDDNGTIATLLPQKTCDNVLYEANYQAIISLFIVGGFIAIFYTLSHMIMDLNLLFPFKFLLDKFLPNNLTDGILFGLIECTNGAKMLAAYKSRLSISLICLIISLGGLSVWIQSITYLQKAKLKCRYFMLSKLLHGIISFILCYFVLGLV